MVVLILTKSNKGDAFIEGQDMLNGGVIEECEWIEDETWLGQLTQIFPIVIHAEKLEKLLTCSLSSPITTSTSFPSLGLGQVVDVEDSSPGPWRGDSSHMINIHLTEIF